VDLMLTLAAGLALGMLLGLLGGGGGIIAVPLLLALGLPYESATTVSLVVVGIGAAAGLAMHARADRVDWAIGGTFGLLGSVGAVAGSRASTVVDVRVQMAGFVVLLLAAAVGMLRRRTVVTTDDDGPLPDPRWGRVVLLATGVGFITGFFGVGGGFIAVPALVLAVKMPMHRASATALLVIVINTAVAFLARGTVHLDHTVTVTIALATAAGAVVGAILQPRIRAASLQQAFGVLLIVVAAYEALQVVTV
jgi:uncharacterized protein